MSGISVEIIANLDEMTNLLLIQITHCGRFHPSFYVKCIAISIDYLRKQA